MWINICVYQLLINSDKVYIMYLNAYCCNFTKLKYTCTLRDTLICKYNNNKNKNYYFHTCSYLFRICM